MGGVSAVHMMGQQAMGAGIRAGSATEDEGSCSQSSAQDQQPFDGRNCEAASAEVGFSAGDGFETPRERGKMATEAPGQDSVGEGGSLRGSEGASGMGTGGYAHVRAPDHAPAGKRSPEEAMGAESDRSVRRRKFGVFLDHGVLESVRNGDTGSEVLGSKDKDSAPSRAVDALLHLEGGHPMRSPASSDSGGSVANGSAAAGSGSPGTPASGTTGPSAGSPRAGTPPGNCLSPMLIKRKFASLPPTVNTVGEILFVRCMAHGMSGLCGGVCVLYLCFVSLFTVHIRQSIFKIDIRYSHAHSMRD